MALPWLAPVLKHSSLATKSASFGQFCTSQFETRYKNGNPRGGIDFLTHLVRTLLSRSSFITKFTPTNPVDGRGGKRRVDSVKESYGRRV